MENGEQMSGDGFQLPTNVDKGPQQEENPVSAQQPASKKRKKIVQPNIPAKRSQPQEETPSASTLSSKESNASDVEPKKTLQPTIPPQRPRAKEDPPATSSTLHFEESNASDVEQKKTLQPMIPPPRSRAKEDSPVTSSTLSSIKSNASDVKPKKTFQPTIPPPRPRAKEDPPTTSSTLRSEESNVGDVKPKKTFHPTIPPPRPRAKEDSPVTSSTLTPSTTFQAGDWGFEEKGRGFVQSSGRGTGMGRGFVPSSGRGMGRGRQIIQTTGGLFGQGPSESPNLRGLAKKKKISTQNRPDPNPSSVNIKEETMKNLYDLLATVPGEFEEREPTPGGIRTKLLPHQKSALNRLLWQENVNKKGGIIGDDPGLGKTLQMVSLMAEQKLVRLKNESQQGPVQQPDDLLVRQAHTTIVICPTSVMHHWKDEIERHCKKGFLSAIIFHGNNREKKSLKLHEYDVVITNYETLRAEIEDLAINKGDERNPIGDFDQLTQKRLIEQSALLKIEFERIVLDEGHYIKNPETQLSMVVCRIRAKRRWIITATPIHNSPSDLYPMMRFLRMHPFDNIEKWNAWVNPAKEDTGEDEGVDKSKTRLQLVLGTLLLRRTKDSKNAHGDILVTLPQKVVEDVKIFLMEKERDVYNEVFNAQLEEYWNKTSDTERKGQGLVRQLHLRQLACHPDLPNWQSKKTVEAATGGPSITLNSGKMQYMITHVPQIIKAGHRIIFASQWTSHLDIYEILCKTMGWSYQKLVGEDSPSARQKVVRIFNQKEKQKDGSPVPPILLLSLGAGCVGLNLIGGNHLFLLDLHYNPQLEAQAFDRIHRVGQEKPVFIHRLCAVGTIEEDVMRNQQEKLEMARQILDGSIDWDDVTFDFIQKVFHPDKMKQMKNKKL